MELKLMQEELPVWNSGGAVTKQSLLTAETVVPDTQEDVGRIVWVQGGLLLKGKDLSPGGVTVAGEARASILYLTEEGSLAGLRVTKPFSLDFETGEPDPDALPELAWTLSRVEARALNPRKLAVSFAVTAWLRSYQRGVLPVNAALPEERPGLHLLRSQREAMAITGVWEKPFSIREQFPVPDGKPCPVHLLGEELRFESLEVEQIGSRSVVKGELLLEVWGLDGEGLPVRSGFSAPFSQLLDTGEGSWDARTLRVEPSSCYLDWVDGLGGERALDAELHAVVQLCAWSRVQPVTVSDAYSTRMPCAVQGEERTLLRSLEQGSARLSAEERLPLPEDYADLLAVQTSWETPESDREGLRLTLLLDLLVRRTDGSLDAVRRILRMEGPALAEGSLLWEAQPTLCDLRPEEGGLRVRCEAQIPWLREERERFFCLTDLSLDEEGAWDAEALPALSLVRRREGESLWELAKAFRASPEAIAATNPEGGELLLVAAE